VGRQARNLARAGFEVIVMDKKDFPRGKVCAGWITPEVVDTLQLNIQEYAQGRTVQPIIGFRLGMIDGKQIETLYDHVVSYGILRREFDEYLLRRSGAQLMLGVPFQGIARRHGWRVNDSIHARLVIGAGGHFCQWRANGCKAGKREVVAAQEMNSNFQGKFLIVR
jgi:flavin-dependent dehydrogenase